MSESLFEQLRSSQGIFESLPPRQARCVVCWQISRATQFTRDHVPPKAVAELSGEDTQIILTCKTCNNEFGSKYQNHLKEYLRYQQFIQRGVGNNFRGDVSILGVGKQKAEITWGNNLLFIAGVPRASNPTEIESINQYLSQEPVNLQVYLTHCFHNPRRAAVALLHCAYSQAILSLGVQYAYSRAGEQLRSMFDSVSCEEIQNYVLAPVVTSVRTLTKGDPFVWQLTKPRSLQALWVKIANNVVVLPLPTHGTAVYRRYWRKSSSVVSHLGLQPRIRLMSLSALDSSSKTRLRQLNREEP